MSQHTIILTLIVEAPTPEFAQGIAAHLAESLRNDGAAVGATAQAALYAAGWDVRNQGEGVELYTTKTAAVEAVLSWVDADHLDEAGMTREEARQQLTESGYLHFENRDCYYRVSAQGVNT